MRLLNGSNVMANGSVTTTTATTGEDSAGGGEISAHPALRGLSVKQLGGLLLSGKKYPPLSFHHHMDWLEGRKE